MNAREFSAVIAIARIAQRNPSFAERVLKYTWLGGVFTDHEQKTLSVLYYFKEKAGIEATKQVMDYQWLADGVTGEEMELLIELDNLVDDDPEAARQISLGTLAPYLLGLISESAGQAADFPWLADGVNAQELPAVIGIARIARQAPDLADRLLGYSWLADGASERESDGIDRLAHLASRDLELARQVVGMGILDDPLRDRGLHAITSLSRFVGTDDMTLLVNQPWFVDGLTDEETAFLAVTNRDKQSDAVYRDFLRVPYARSGTITLPLAGDVDVWAFWDSPFPASDDTIELLKDAARASEALMGVPFPTTDIILLMGDSDRVGVSGYHVGNHIAAQRWVGEGNHRGVIYHETTSEYDLPDCVEQGYRNIQELLDKDGPPCLGELFLDSLLQLLGEDAMSGAVRELYLMRTEGREPTEEDVYRIFLKHTPAGLEDEFRDIYKRLHAGPYADTDT